MDSTSYLNFLKTCTDDQLDEIYAKVAPVDWWKANLVCIERDHRKGLQPEPHAKIKMRFLEAPESLKALIRRENAEIDPEPDKSLKK